MSSALIRGDTLLLGRSVRAEIVGVVLAVAMSGCLGYLVPSYEPTTEMLARTNPNLLDLLVAVFAGFAGAFAVVDERISPTLPGVAVATSIVPPLANTGLCIAQGAFIGATGSFLLFFANFLSILLVASIVFAASGMTFEIGKMTKRNQFRRFGTAAIGFVMVTAFLSKNLYEITQARRLERSIDSVLREEISHLPVAELQKIVHQRHEDTIYVLAHLHAPSDISPTRVTAMEEKLEEKLEKPVELFVRNTLSKDVSSSGSINQVITESLDGFYFSQKPDPKIKIIKLAEQTIREFLASRLGLYVKEVNLLSIERRPVILATVFGVRKLGTSEIRDLETGIRQRVENDTLTLAIRHVNVDLYDRWGKAHYEWSMFEEITPEMQNAFERMEAFLKTAFHTSEYFLTNLDIAIHDDTYQVLVELSGPRLFPQSGVAGLSEELSRMVDGQVEVYVHSRPEVVVTEDGFVSWDILRRRLLGQVETQYDKEIKKILEEVL
jgi:uncharacterized hydrophobic protein (TIGR00271 family)